MRGVDECRMLNVVRESSVEAETRLECQLEEVLVMGYWRRSLRDIITMQLSLINTSAYLVVIKIRN